MECARQSSQPSLHSIDLRENILGPRPVPLSEHQSDFDCVEVPFHLHGLPHPRDIPLAREFVKGHTFEDLVCKADFLNSSDIQRVIAAQNLRLSIPTYETGAVPAASNEGNVQTSNATLSSYAHHSWHRDAALVALALKNSGHTDQARAVLESLWRFNASAEQRNRFVSYLFADRSGNYTPASWFQQGRNIPHIRSRIENGELISEPAWGHQQLDAHGLVLWTLFRFANQKVIDLPRMVQSLEQRINPDNAIDCTPSLMIKFLNRIQYWDQKDFGPWEDEMHSKRATSIGCCVLALQEAQKYFRTQRQGYAVLPSGSGANSAAELQAELEHALEKGRGALAQRIPFDGELAVECDKYKSDAANILLLYPLSGLSKQQENAILRRVYERENGQFKRIHEIGISRRDRDDYVGMDYHREVNRQGLFSDMSRPDYEPAQWTLFDPLLVGYHARNFIDSGGLDLASYHYAQVHMKRMLTHPTRDEYSYRLAYDGTQVRIPAGVIPEGYFKDSQSNLQLPNHNSPLLMANAAFGLALERMRDAIRLYEIRSRNSSR